MGTFTINGVLANEIIAVIGRSYVSLGPPYSVTPVCAQLAQRLGTGRLAVRAVWAEEPVL